MSRGWLLWACLSFVCAGPFDGIHTSTDNSEKSSNPYADASFHHESSLSQSILPDAISSDDPESIPSESSRTESYSSYAARLSSMAESSSGPSLAGGWSLPWQKVFNPSVGDANTVSNTAATTNAALGALGAVFFGHHWYRRHGLIQKLTNHDGGCGIVLDRVEAMPIEELQKMVDACMPKSTAAAGRAGSSTPAQLSHSLIQTCGVEIPLGEITKSASYKQFMSGEGPVGWFDVQGSNYDTLCPLVNSADYLGDLQQMGPGANVDSPLSSSGSTLTVMAAYCVALLDRPVASRVDREDICSKFMMIARMAFYGPRRSLGVFCDAESSSTFTTGCLKKAILDVYKELNEIAPTLTSEDDDVHALRGSLVFIKLQQVLQVHCHKLRRPSKVPKWSSDYVQDSLKTIYSVMLLGDEVEAQQYALEHFCSNDGASIDIAIFKEQLEDAFSSCTAPKAERTGDDSEESERDTLQQASHGLAEVFEEHTKQHPRKRYATIEEVKLASHPLATSEKVGALPKRSTTIDGSTSTSVSVPDQGLLTTPLRQDREDETDSLRVERPVTGSVVRTDEPEG